MECASKTVLWT